MLLTYDITLTSLCCFCLRFTETYVYFYDAIDWMVMLMLLLIKISILYELFKKIIQKWICTCLYLILWWWDGTLLGHRHIRLRTFILLMYAFAVSQGSTLELKIHEVGVDVFILYFYWDFFLRLTCERAIMGSWTCLVWMILTSQLTLSSNFSGYSGLFELFIVMIIFNVYMLVLFIET